MYKLLPKILFRTPHVHWSMNIVPRSFSSGFSFPDLTKETKEEIRWLNKYCFGYFWYCAVTIIASFCSSQYIMLFYSLTLNITHFWNLLVGKRVGSSFVSDLKLISNRLTARLRSKIGSVIVVLYNVAPYGDWKSRDLCIQNWFALTKIVLLMDDLNDNSNSLPALTSHWH